MKKLAHYEKLTIILFFIAVILLVVSLIPAGWSEATGILQGIATGIISGILLLFVSGYKSQELKQLGIILEEINQLNENLEDSITIYSDLYHETYHGKKHQLGENGYKNRLIDACQRLQQLWEKYCNLKQELKNAYLLETGVSEFTSEQERSITQKINTLSGLIQDCDMSFDKLDENREFIGNIGHEIMLLSKYYRREIQSKLVEKIEHINNSII